MRGPLWQARPRAEALVLTLVASAPAAPYAASLTRGIPRFSMLGDYAIIEMMTRLVWSGRTLVGPYSRYHFSHPGPLYFYLLAPVYTLLGGRSVGIFAGALLINLAAIATIVFAARCYGSRLHAAAAVVTVLSWFAAFGNVCVNPWNPLVIALPIAAYLVLAAFFAQGESFAVCPLALIGVFAAQTHVAAFTTVIGVGAVATAVFLRQRRKSGLTPRERRHLRIALGVLLVTSVPPLIEQLSPGRGNLRNLASFFFDPPEAPAPWSTAFVDWATATSWLPDRVLHPALGLERGIPLPMRWDAIPATLPPTARNFALLHGVLLVAAGMVCRRRRDGRSAALLVVGVGAEVISLVTLRGIYGKHFHYLLFWVVAANAVAWVGVLSALGSAVRDAVVRLPVWVGRVGLGVAAAGGVGAVIGAVWLQGEWISRNVVATSAREDVREVYEAVLQRIRRDGVNPVVHLDGAWPIATVFVLELSKDGVRSYLVERDRWMFGRPPLASEAGRAVHFYVGDSIKPLGIASCLEPFAKAGDVEVFVSQGDVERCP
jgi:hypothetical protein